jgi:hypothetical protein
MSGALARLRRWEDAGGTWRAVPAPGGLTLVLCRCDGGEEVDRLTSSEGDVAAYVGGRRSSEDDARP